MLCGHLDDDLADAIQFLFYSTWRIGEVRTLQWRDHDRTDRVIRLRAERSKNKHARILPVEGALAAIIERRLQKRRLDCSYVHAAGRVEAMSGTHQVRNMRGVGTAIDYGLWRRKS